MGCDRFCRDVSRRKRLRKNNRKTARGIQLESARSEEGGKKGKSKRRNNNESEERIKKKKNGQKWKD